MQFSSITRLQRLREIADSCDGKISLHPLSDGVHVDAKPFIDLLTLDFVRPVKVVVDSGYLARRVKYPKHRMEK